MTPPIIAAIYIHPVKSCRRVEVDQAIVSAYGFEGDREWQIQNPAGQLMTQREYPAMARVQPVLVSGGLRLQHDDLPDLDVESPQVVGHGLRGRKAIADAGDEAAAWLARALSVECRLITMATGYARRAVVGGHDLFDQDVAFVDGAPAHLVSTASYRFLLAHAAEPFPIERFRPNLVVEGGEPWEEDTWQRLSIGDAQLEVKLPWPRCAMPQVDQETGERHREPAVVLKRLRWCSDAPSLPAEVQPLVTGNALFGIAAAISPAGAVIRRGATVDVLATGAPLLAAPV